ncbi:MAG: hypothetical protein Devi2KO_17320 [Devosia indica]
MRGLVFLAAAVFTLSGVLSKASARMPALPLASSDQHRPPEEWLDLHRARVSAKAPLGEAPSYIAKYWTGLELFLTDGRIELDNNAVERTIRPIALNRKNALFAGHDAGAETWAVIASLIETCKLNGVEPHAWLAAALHAIVTGHRQSRINDLLPRNYPASLGD